MGLFLTFICSIAWVASDAMRKHLSDRTPPFVLASRLAIGQALCLFIVIPVLFFAKPLDGWSEFEISDGYLLWALPSFLATAAGHLFFLGALKVSQLGLTIPFLSFSPLFVMLFAWLVLGETPSWQACVGLSVVTFGAYALNPSRTVKGKTDEQSAFAKGAALMTLTAVSWSAAAAFDKAAMEYATPLTHLTCLLISSAVILGMLAKFKSRSPETKTTHKWVLPLVCLVMCCALALQLGAYHFWQVAYVETTKRALGLIGAVTVGYFVFKEGHIKQRLGAVSLMSLGVGLVILGQ